MADKMVDIGSVFTNGVGFVKKIPILQDFELQRQERIKLKVCWDDCGKMISKKEVSRELLDKYREIWWNPTKEIRGEPIWVLSGAENFPTYGRWIEYGVFTDL